jgi:hypothetical protein
MADCSIDSAGDIVDAAAPFPADASAAAAPFPYSFLLFLSDMDVQKCSFKSLCHVPPALRSDANAM